MLPGASQAYSKLHYLSFSECSRHAFHMYARSARLYPPRFLLPRRAIALSSCNIFAGPIAPNPTTPHKGIEQRHVNFAVVETSIFSYQYPILNRWVSHAHLSAPLLSTPLVPVTELSELCSLLESLPQPSPCPRTSVNYAHSRRTGGGHVETLGQFLIQREVQAAHPAACWTAPSTRNLPPLCLVVNTLCRRRRHGTAAYPSNGSIPHGQVRHHAGRLACGSRERSRRSPLKSRA